MIGYEKRFWILAAGLAAVAGYVDAVGFSQLGGFFVSFMSGNSTRLAVGTVTDLAAARTAGGLVGAFVIGVIAGSFAAAAAGRHRKPVILLLVSLLLAGAALTDMIVGRSAALFLAAAMGAENAVFQRDGEVSIGVTYMTGTLVKFGQRLAAAFMGGPRWSWAPYLALWCSLTLGAVIGTIVYVRFGLAAIWAPAGVTGLLAAYAAVIGPSAHAR
ncbi:YoaK family protein [Sphingomonas sp. MMS24-J13]|uniref:YoaK family protein n=1 Tax=Sphingomonas sp. MMS24-J13 TaxID=3238686 RepID=UPI003851158C